MSYSTKYIAGQYNVRCDICARYVKASQTRLDWKGLRVCIQDWEAKPGQLYPTPPPPDDQRAVPNARPPTPTGSESYQVGDTNYFGWEDINYTNWEDWGNIHGRIEFWQNIINLPTAYNTSLFDYFNPTEHGTTWNANGQTWNQEFRTWVEVDE